MNSAFCRYDLRTTDPEAARRFYADAVGLEFSEGRSGLAVWPLHEQARARGAPAHWLGHVGVTDLAAAVGAAEAARIIAWVASNLGRRVKSLATTEFWTAVPLAYGPYAAKLRLQPRDTTPSGASVSDPDYLRHDLSGPSRDPNDPQLRGPGNGLP